MDNGTDRRNLPFPRSVKVTPAGAPVSVSDGAGDPVAVPLKKSAPPGLEIVAGGAGDRRCGADGEGEGLGGGGDGVGRGERDRVAAGCGARGDQQRRGAAPLSVKAVPAGRAPVTASAGAGDPVVVTVNPATVIPPRRGQLIGPSFASVPPMLAAHAADAARSRPTVRR